MKVYLVIYTLWDDFHVECVCSSRDLAEQALVELSREDDSGVISEENYIIQEWEVNKTNLWTVEYMLGSWRAKRLGVSFAHMEPEKLDDNYYIVRVEADDTLEAIHSGKEIISLRFPEVLSEKK